MERLGVLYMLKLCYGDDFANQAGSTWRLLLVMSLMPWLRRYRINELEDELPEEGEEQMHALQKYKMASSRRLDIMLDGEDDDVWDKKELTTVHEDTSFSSLSDEDLKKENAVLRRKLKALEKRLFESHYLVRAATSLPIDFMDRNVDDDDDDDQQSC